MQFGHQSLCNVLLQSRGSVDQTMTRLSTLLIVIRTVDIHRVMTVLYRRQIHAMQRS